MLGNTTILATTTEEQEVENIVRTLSQHSGGNAPSNGAGRGSNPSTPFSASGYIPLSKPSSAGDTWGSTLGSAGLGSGGIGSAGLGSGGLGSGGLGSGGLGSGGLGSGGLGSGGLGSGGLGSGGLGSGGLGSGGLGSSGLGSSGLGSGGLSSGVSLGWPSSGLGGSVWGAPDNDQHNRTTPLNSFLPPDLLSEGM